ncbi:hypothetical protein ACFWEJ_04420 [Promicromonospora sp. NPDC060204]|uniref:hypothetical protein n=1 Tax=Promicromonospora sp. NPDC060204 TaxID=3347071 RepID=UPI003647F1CB
MAQLAPVQGHRYAVDGLRGEPGGQALHRRSVAAAVGAVGAVAATTVVAVTVTVTIAVAVAAVTLAGILTCSAGDTG